jgi:chromosome segregation ATPase
MEIARLTAICRKSDCGPLENELVRLRAQIATLEECKTGDSEAKAEEEMEFAPQADAEGELARVRAELEEKKLKNAELDSKNDDLDSKVDDLEIEILVIKSKLASPPPCEDCVVHEGDYKEIYDLYNEGLDENMQQYQQIVELEFENEELKDQMAMMATEGPVAGFGVAI